MSTPPNHKQAPTRPTSIDPNLPRSFIHTTGILTSTTNELAGYRTLKTLGTVYGLTVRCCDTGTNMGRSLRSSSFGGESRSATMTMYSGRWEAMERMVGECKARGGNAVVGVRFDGGMDQVSAQICAYGTAVLVEEVRQVMPTSQAQTEK